MNSAQLLKSGAQQLQLSINESQIQALLHYVELLQKWNKTYNLTAIEATDEIIRKHILDSLSLVPYLNGSRVFDVGSGAGLPGIPLAIVCKDKQFLLLDASVKKTRFIQQAIIEVRLNNVQVVQQRVERYAPQHEFDTVVSRAFASSEKLFASTDHLLTQGQFILMLGKQTQLQELPDCYVLVGVYAVQIPGLQASRHIAVVEKQMGHG
jgi:16S rRNA (guanine527-N7)-methyltransferase